MANTDKILSASVKSGALFLRDTGKYASSGVKAGPFVLHGVGKNTTANIKATTSVLHGVDKYVGASVKTGPTVLRGVGKKLSSNTKITSSVLHAIGKKLSVSIKTSPLVLHNIGKNINANVRLTSTVLKNTATLTMVYNGNAELGLGSQEGSQFNIIVTGTFSVFSISINGKTLTYTENCVAQTITIDNVNATVKNGTVNKLSKVTGDVADFLKLIPGNNTITISKTGGNVDFQWDFRPQFI